MTVELLFEEIVEWPRLSWLAICQSRLPAVRVIHGSGIETHEDWYCEAVWDGPFHRGDFDRSDVVFGSGARLRADGLRFVSSASTVDRLHLCQTGPLTLVSNSLPCVISAVDARLAPDGSGYMDFFTSVGRGIDHYRADLEISKGTVRLVYFDNLVWNGHAMDRESKAEAHVHLRSYTDYVGYLQATLQNLSVNLQSTERVRPYDWLGTLSRGFDSPTCVALARDFGLERAIAFAESRPGIRDDGKAIGEALGVETVVLDRLGWRSQAVLEPLFVAADAQGKEISVAAARHLVTQTVLVTGHGGDYVWNTRARNSLEGLARGGYSGLSMSEYRLHAGFVHMPLPFIGMRRAADIHAISQSTDMDPFRLGGSYDRPICRRVLREAGIPDSLFGQSKTGNSVRFVIGEDQWSRPGKRALWNWIWSNRRANRLSRTTMVKLLAFELCLSITLTVRRPLGGVVLRAADRLRRFLAHRVRLLGGHDIAFRWAVDQVAEAYSVRPRDDAGPHARSGS